MNKFIMLPTLVFVFAVFPIACANAPIDVYYIPVARIGTITLQHHQIGALKVGFHALCARYSLHREGKPEDVNDEYEGIWFVYTRSGDFPRNEGMGVVFGRFRGDINIAVQTSGCVPEPTFITSFKSDLLKMLNDTLGPENIRHELERSSAFP
jgi:hypothetical protein